MNNVKTTTRLTTVSHHLRMLVGCLLFSLCLPTMATEPQAQSNEVVATADSVKQQSAAASVVEAGMVNINSATVEELVEGLKGIGTKKAEAIVSYRDRYGAFSSVEQLQEVPGIGPSILERNLPALKL